MQRIAPCARLVAAPEGAKDGTLGTGTFRVDDTVKKYIVDKLKEVVNAKGAKGATKAAKAAKGAKAATPTTLAGWLAELGGLVEVDCGTNGWCGWNSLAEALGMDVGDLLRAMIAAIDKLKRKQGSPDPRPRLLEILDAHERHAPSIEHWYSSDVDGKLVAMAVKRPVLALSPVDTDWRDGKGNWQLTVYRPTTPHYQGNLDTAAAHLELRKNAVTLVHQSRIHWVVAARPKEPAPAPGSVPEPAPLAW